MIARRRRDVRSVALDRGVPLHIVSARVGYVDTIIAARTYGHLISDDRLDAFARCSTR
jgi:hypothetical protein